MVVAEARVIIESRQTTSIWCTLGFLDVVAIRCHCNDHGVMLGFFFVSFSNAGAMRRGWTVGLQALCQGHVGVAICPYTRTLSPS